MVAASPLAPRACECLEISNRAGGRPCSSHAFGVLLAWHVRYTKKKHDSDLLEEVVRCTKKHDSDVTDYYYDDKKSGMDPRQARGERIGQCNPQALSSNSVACFRRRHWDEGTYAMSAVMIARVVSFAEIGWFRTLTTRWMGF